MKWARFDGNRVIETTDIDPKGRFHASLIWDVVPDDVTPNSLLNGDTWEIYKEKTRADFLRESIQKMESYSHLSDQMALFKAELESLESVQNEA